MSEHKSKTFENYCFQCYHYEPSIGTCNKIHENVRNYPRKFITKCNGEFFKKDQTKITNETSEYNSIEDYQEGTDKLDREVKSIYQFSTLLGFGKFISGFGSIIIVLGIVGILGGLISGEDFLGYSIASAGAILVLIGIGMTVNGQLISCFVSIERNTRMTYEMLKNRT